MLGKKKIFHEPVQLPGPDTVPQVLAEYMAELTAPGSAGATQTWAS